MSRGDGKAQRGRTRGSNVIRMAAGGNLAGRDAAMGGAAVGSRAEASRGSSGAGNAGSMAGSAGRDGGGGTGRQGPSGGAGGGGNQRENMRSPASNAARNDYLRDANRASARLGPNAAQAMADAGVNPTVANLGAQSINRLSSNGTSKTASSDRLATFNPDGTITYSGVPNLTKPLKFQDRILPEAETIPAKTQYPTRPISYTGVPKMEGVPIDTGWNPATGTFNAPPTSTLPSARMTSAQDMASIVPGSVSFTQKNQFTPFAKTQQGLNLLKQAEKPLSYKQAQELMQKLPKGTAYTMAGKPVPEGFTGFPVTAAGYKLSVNVPNTAGVNKPGPKVGQYNESAPAPTRVANKPIQDRISASKKEIQDRLPGMSGKTVGPQYTPAKPTAATNVSTKAPSAVVASPRASASAGFQFGGEGNKGGGRWRNKKKKPIIKEDAVTNARDGGSIRGNGKALFGKTRGRMV